MSSNLPIIVLAAGASSRFVPFNNGSHKSLATVWGKSLLGHCLSSLQASGYDQICVVVGPDDHPLSASHQHQLGVNAAGITWALQPTPKGMADAITIGWQDLGQPPRVGVVSSYHLQAGPTLDQMLLQGSETVLSIHPTERPELYGIVTLSGQNIIGVVEKPQAGTEPSKYKLQSVYILGERVLTGLANVITEEYGFEALLDKVAREHGVHAYFNPEDLPSLKYSWHLFNFQAELAKNQSSYTAPTAQIASTAMLDDSAGPIVIADHAVVGHAAKIVGPTYLGPEALVGDFSFVRQSSLGAGVKVGANTEVVRSIIMENTSIHFGYLADSILGRGVKIGAGLINANKRLDRQTIKTKIKDQVTDTGLTGFGCCIGDQAQLGIRTNIMPGVLIGTKALIFPGQTIYHNVAAHDVIKPSI